MKIRIVESPRELVRSLNDMEGSLDLLLSVFDATARGGPEGIEGPRVEDESNRPAVVAGEDTGREEVSFRGVEFRLMS